MKVLLTGIAGFIGSAFALELLEEGFQVVGIDNLNQYYDVKLKLDRLVYIGLPRIISPNGMDRGDRISAAAKNLVFYQADLEDRRKLEDIFKKEKPDYVINLAAQAGVRYSLENPHSYINSNITGFINILENCRQYSVKHLVYASSSSVYGLSSKIPFRESDGADHPASLYGATKKANELMAHAYSHLFKIPSTGLRFFTVYGPWGRPDMSPMIFARQIYEGQELRVFNYGDMERDFTYIDDIVKGMMLVLERIPEQDPDWDPDNPDPSSSSAPYRVYNIGNTHPVGLKKFISILEKEIGIKARQKFLPLQPGDVVRTHASVDKLNHLSGFEPDTGLTAGIKQFIQWFREYYGYN